MAESTDLASMSKDFSIENVFHYRHASGGANQRAVFNSLSFVIYRDHILALYGGRVLGRDKPAPEARQRRH